MNANPRLSAILIATMFLPVPPSLASVAVVSNLEEEAEASSALRDSAGALLPLGCEVRVVSFPGKSEAEVRDLAGNGLSILMAAAATFGEPSVVGAGSDGAGTIEFQCAAPLESPLEEAYVLVTKAASSELLLLKFPQVIPADDLTGPEGHVTGHLDDAQVVFGSRNADGFSTAVSPSVVAPTLFEAWITGELGEDAPLIDRLPGADADRDGLDNLIEYATGSQPGDGGSRFSLRLRRAPDGTHFVQYLRRVGDPALAYTAERLANDGAGPWIALEGTAVIPQVAPSPAPASFEWVEQPLPAGTSGFARLRVELGEP